MTIKLRWLIIDISQDEFLILTHSEKEKYGSSIGENLRVAFIKDAGFQWQNVALLDTPGYSSSEMEHSARTDAKVARAQLNTAQLIVWVVAIDNGTISEEDLNFLSQLHNDIPKLIVISRADKKQPEDVNAVVDAVRQSLARKELEVLDVVAVSARKNKDFPISPVLDWLDTWNNMKQQEPTFAKTINDVLVNCYDSLLSQKIKFIDAEEESIHAYATKVLKSMQEIETMAKEKKLTPDDLYNIDILKKMPSSLIQKINEALKDLEDSVTNFQDSLQQKDLLQSEAKKLRKINIELELNRQDFLIALSDLGSQIGYLSWCSEFY